MKGKCKFCLQVKPFVRAHIIPVGLFPRNPNGDRFHYLLDGDGEKPISKIPNGVYDDNLVCAECEALFAEGDDYAKRFLVDDVETSYERFEGRVRYWEYPSFDYRRLKLFFISLLWRAHASSRPDWKLVDLGSKYAQMAKDLIQAGDPGSPDVFAVLLVRWAPGPHRLIGTSFTPRRTPHLTSVRYYDAALFGYNVWVKVARQPFPYPMDKYQIDGSRPLLILEKSIEESRYVDFAIEGMVNSWAAKARLKNRATR